MPSTTASRPSHCPTDMRNVQRQAFAGLLWSKQYYHYFVEPLAGRRSGPAAPAARAQAGPQPRLAAPRRRRRAVDAGQVGVPVVRRLGHGVPCRRVRADRSGFRQGAAAAADARVVHAPERPDPGLRVEVRRRESAGARLGGLRVYQIEEKFDGRARPRLSRTRLPEAADQLHLVGEPQGQRRQQPVRRRLPRAGQHQRLRPHRRPARRRTPRTGRRHELDGDVLPEHARHRAGARQGRRRLRGRRDQVLRAFRLHRRRGEPDLRRRRRTVGRGARLLLRRADACRATACIPIRAHTIAGLIPLLRSRWPTGDRFPPSATSATRFRWFAKNRPELLGRPGRHDATAASTTASGWRWSTPRSSRASWSRCSTRKACSAHTACARCRSATPPIPSSCASTARCSRSTTSRPSRPTACSAATPTGAGRCGFRSTSC